MTILDFFRNLGEERKKKILQVVWVYNDGGKNFRKEQNILSNWNKNELQKFHYNHKRTESSQRKKE